MNDRKKRIFIAFLPHYKIFSVKRLLRKYKFALKHHTITYQSSNYLSKHEAISWKISIMWKTTERHKQERERGNIFIFRFA